MLGLVCETQFPFLLVKIDSRPSAFLNVLSNSGVHAAWGFPRLLHQG